MMTPPASSMRGMAASRHVEDPFTIDPDDLVPIRLRRFRHGFLDLYAGIADDNRRCPQTELGLGQKLLAIGTLRHIRL